MIKSELQNSKNKAGKILLEKRNPNNQMIIGVFAEPKGLHIPDGNPIQIYALFNFLFLHAYESKHATLIKTQNPKLSFRISFAESKGFEPLEV